MTRFELVRLVVVSPLLLSAPFLSGCSVGMAVSGKENPNVAVFQAGSTRLDIERELGRPKDSIAHEDGTLQCVYVYEVGNEPSAVRAVMHGGLDILTLGLWEVVGTPIEASQGEKYEMTVVYGPDDVTKSVTTKKIESAPTKEDRDPYGSEQGD